MQDWEVEGRELAYVDGEIPNGRKEDLDIRAGNKFRVHSSGVFKKRPTKQALGAIIPR